MKSYTKISIPKPCHENWNAMTPNEKGRFCSSCCKTVVDFTKMHANDIRTYLKEHKTEGVCGHIKQSQLDSINLQIPISILQQNKSFKKVFLLALLITMGTTIMSCKQQNGTTQKIDSIAVIDSTTTSKPTDSILKPHKTSTDSLTCNNTDSYQNIRIDTIETTTTGIMVEGEIMIDDFPVVGDIDYDGDDQDSPINFINLDEYPEFYNTPKHFTKSQKKDYFTNQLSAYVQSNFNRSLFDTLALSKSSRIFCQFEINSTGLIDNIRTRANHPLLEQEAKRVLQSLPVLKPGLQNNTPVSVIYSLPITFKPEN